MFIAGIILAVIVVAIVAGALIYRNNQKKIETTMSKVVAIPKAVEQKIESVKDAVKK